ncbi:MAG: hypothetical protein AMJ75_07510 [Phycisphaerae bacterium SM1_79]|nr:MAG: hypothetical protein AMJ75_07510 [Phycisphaerae bacterium SM1_79]
MTKISLISAVVLVSALVETAAPSAFSNFEVNNKIDELVAAKWKKLGIEPSGLCRDHEFVRRAYLDVIGTLPTAKEARDFILDKNTKKRSALIDNLLEREEFADYWAMKWSDLLRVKAEFPINLWPNAVQAYHHWIRTSIKKNMPYDKFVRELLVSSGSNFRMAQVNFYRAMQSKEPEVIAQTVALTFMGERADKWDKKRLSGMAGFFSQVGFKTTAEWKEEIVYFDPNRGSTGVRAVIPDGKEAKLSPGKDPRKVFADWLIDAKNPWFTRNIVNRIWSWLLGRGIIHEPDDIRPDNPPSNPELLAFLEKELITAKYDLKHIYRLILNSSTYQRCCIPKTDKPEDIVNFSHYPLRRLEAEVLIDALNQITGTTEKYSSEIPEPFTFVPPEQRSIALADGSITSSFLEMFGRPPRDTGLESERNNSFTAAQRLHLINSSHIQRKIEQGRKLRNLMQVKGNMRQLTTMFYLTILSRFPTNEEVKIVEEYSKSKRGNRRIVAIDLAWALINSAEFLYRH